MVKDRLPDTIECEGQPTIRIIKHPTLSNALVDMDKITELWNSDQYPHDRIDAMLHLGINSSAVWELETRARRDGYSWVGDDGLPLPKHNGEFGARFDGQPEELRPMYDVESLIEEIRSNFPVSGMTLSEPQ